MQIGVIVYSQTGNTLSVATKVQDRLAAADHTVTMERVELAPGSDPNSMNFELKTTPEVAGYEAVLFASPVQAFSLAAPMNRYLKLVGSLQGKRVACLVTEAFPYAWLGGNRAIRQMKRICQSKGAEVCESGIVNWMRKTRDEQIEDVVDCLSAAF